MNNTIKIQHLSTKLFSIANRLDECTIDKKIVLEKVYEYNEQLRVLLTEELSTAKEDN